MKLLLRRRKLLLEIEGWVEENEIMIHDGYTRFCEDLRRLTNDGEDEGYDMHSS